MHEVEQNGNRIDQRRKARDEPNQRNSRVDTHTVETQQMAPQRRYVQGDDLDSAVFLRHPDKTFECLVCPKRKNKPVVMKIGHAREHASSGVHQWCLKAASRVPSGLSRMAGPTPISSNVLDDAQQPLPMRPLTVRSDSPVRGDTLFTTHSPPSHAANSPPSNHDVDLPFFDLFSAVEGSNYDGPLLLDDSWMKEPLHIDNSHDDGYELSALSTQLGCRTDSVNSSSLLDEDSPFQIPGENDDQGNLHTGDLNIDFDGDQPILPDLSVAVSRNLLFSSPRLRFSVPQKKAVLEWALQLGARDVPTFYALSQSQEYIKGLVGNSVTAVTTGAGHKIFVQDIPYMIAKDYANPLTRFAIWDYPIDGEGYAAQLFHGSKMLFDISPALVVPTRFFYQLPEGVKLSGNPSISDLIEHGDSPPVYEPSVHDLWSIGCKAERTEAGFIVSDEKTSVRVDHFQRSFSDIRSSKQEFACGFTETSREYGSLMPHPLRAKADGRMVYTVPVIIFMDDASANISKQWNKHIVVYLSNAGLPREMLDKEFCTRFVTSSRMLHQWNSCVRKALDLPVVTYDCKTRKEIMIIPYLIFTASDNPMHAEQTSHCGLNSNYFCRTCHVGGTKAYKKTDEGFGKLFEIGQIRDPDNTRREIEQQLELCVLPGGSDKVDLAARSSGIKDATVVPILSYITTKGKELRSKKLPNGNETGDETPTQNSSDLVQVIPGPDSMDVDECCIDNPDLTATPGDVQQHDAVLHIAYEAEKLASASLRENMGRLSEPEIQAMLGEELEALLKKSGINPLIGMPGFNIHLDTPTEILHTVLLGVVKYFWAQTIWYLKNRSKSLTLFRTRLSSVKWNGLNAPSTNAEYICQYHNSLIGKHFKSLAQDVLRAWNIIGALVVLLWHTDIEDVECYLASLSRTINDFLNITAKCSPSILISKPKFHFLVHLPAFIRRFGPAIVFSTERYESFNHVFRLSCIFSNRQAPSRDSCNVFAAQDRIKHITTGGFWFDAAAGSWARAGQIVREYVSTRDNIMQWLGIPKEIKSKPESGVRITCTVLASTA
ncbi:hypothetical protein EI94DRAFT_1849401 [Lactarius quietus]|nr:hypothetical protein EI94DRAFT_1849401 [Lactarius quietus]